MLVSRAVGADESACVQRPAEVPFASVSEQRRNGRYRQHNSDRHWLKCSVPGVPLQPFRGSRFHK